MKCAIYIRVSTGKEEQKSSLQNQKELFDKYVGENGWDIYEYYIDIESGTTGKRQNLMRLINDAKERRFDIILAKELSRLARNGELSYQIRNIAEQHRIHIITLDGAINTIEGNSHMFGLYAWIYEQESQQISQRIKRAMKSVAERGFFHRSIAPYGYKVENGQLMIRDDNSPQIVSRIFKEYLEGSGRDSIARRLYKDGVPTPGQVAGKSNANDKWHGSTILKILTNPHYVGDLVQGRSETINVTSKKRKYHPKEKQIIIPNTHEAIISREDFDAVQRQIKVRNKIIPAPKKHLFTNLLYCEDCGGGMWYRSNRKGYICANYAKHGKKACPLSHTVKENHLINLAKENVKATYSKLSDKKFMSQLEQEVLSTLQLNEQKLKELRDRINEIHERKVNYIRLLADNTINKSDYDRAVVQDNVMLKELKKIENQIVNVLDIKRQFDNLQNLKLLLEPYVNIVELTPEVLHRLIERIDVDKYGTPKILFHFSVPLLEKHLH